MVPVAKLSLFFFSVTFPAFVPSGLESQQSKSSFVVCFLFFPFFIAKLCKALCNILRNLLKNDFQTVLSQEFVYDFCFDLRRHKTSQLLT